MAKTPVKRKSLLPETKKKRTVADAVGEKMPKISMEEINKELKTTKIAGDFGDTLKMKGSPSKAELIRAYKQYRLEGNSASKAMDLLKADMTISIGEKQAGIS